jgi:hypothetical protein
VFLPNNASIDTLHLETTLECSNSPGWFIDLIGSSVNYSAENKIQVDQLK